MTTSLQSDPRRTARKNAAQDPLRKPGRLPLEMPVLFQLADLSLQKAAPNVSATAPPPAAATIEPVTQDVVAPVAPIQEPVAVEPPLVAPIAETPTPVVVASTRIEVPHNPQPELTAPAASRKALTQEIAAESNPEIPPDTKVEVPTIAAPKVQPPVANETEAAVQASVTTSIEPSVTDVSPPQERTAPTPRDRTGQRAKNKHAIPGSNSDWMRTHGKYIAVGFVIALIATIYMAQSGDEPTPAKPNATASTKANETEAPAEGEPQVAEAQTAKEAVSAGHNHTSPTLDEASPAQANLSAPKSANTIHEPEPDAEVADSRSLFPWKGTGEARVAGKPEGVKQENAKPQAEAKSPANQENASEGVAQESRADEPSVYGPPGTAPQEEIQQTNGELPQGKTPGAYPETNPGTYRDFAPPANRVRLRGLRRELRPRRTNRAIPTMSPHLPRPETVMSALDQAFIKAYAKDAAPVKEASREDAHVLAAAQRKVRAPQERAANSQIENLYAAGTLYRIETPRVAEPEPVPSPHFAARGSRRLPLRYRLAQMEEEEIAPPVAKRPSIQPARQAVQAQPASPSRRMKATIPTPPAIEPTPVTLPDLSELEAVEEVSAVIEEKQPTLDASNFAFNPVEVRQRWDELLGDSPVVADSAVAVWPQEADFTAAQANALISVDLETLPEPPAAVTEVAMEPAAPAPSSAKSYRLDAAHAAVPAPHEPPQPTVEELIQPAAEERVTKAPEAKVQDRPLVISAEEAAELVGAPLAASPTATTPAPAVATAKPAQQIVPAWEVDRFLWPALCEKLLRDEQSYFAQAGGKIAAAVRDGLKSLAITGSRRGEGRTTLALCLARSAATAGLKVAIVDADFARPQLAASLGLEIAASWHEVALGKTNLSEVAIKSVEDNLTVLPLDVTTAAAPLTLADPRLTKTLREATASFDLLVLDLGPTTAGDSSLFPDDEPPPADAAIVVRDLRYCTPAESQAIGERLCLSGIEAVGIAENFVPQEKLVA